MASVIDKNIKLIASITLKPTIKKNMIKLNISIGN